ncbi:ribosomal protein S18-alanine N-acetyltransferase [Devosia marina]|uniref:Ribosomal protein S18-alanine N-acetyltransferase n=1 Tax=Devosia marina TaxID=2683198 RepID=A0A7X3K3M0_9HYPH|nr:ribosomal protein S18-alanine N-acetyltransferase [Devosia marina]MVS99095.1 ribosomal protein S18-alanine N-acetyltransferase [Devosia marina]
MLKFWMAPGGLHVEPAEIGDAAELARIHALSFYRGWPSPEFESFLADPACPAFVACDARRRIAGFALIRIAADEAELLTIAVDPKWRGKGVGRALLDAVFADLMLSPARRMFLEVDEQNNPAIKLYEKLGFAAISKRKGYYPRPDGSAATALVMARDLG